VIDGDTLEAYVNPWPYVYIKTHIRIIGIDTPELSAKTDCEKTLALQAKLFLEIVLKDAKVVSAYHMRPDPYPGRMDASVTVDGGDLSDRILASGQARPYDGKGKRLVGGWCIGS
jgi:endonuclease YncB( thermonuclease family)